VCLDTRIPYAYKFVKSVAAFERAKQSPDFRPPIRSACQEGLMFEVLSLRS
jgi:hypothetical protein